jgi:hypothetical protein
MARIVRQAGALLLLVGLSGCYAATRSTVHMVEATQKLTEARQAGAPARAVYAWTKADEYMKKARDEWGRSEFQSAERLFAKSKTWSEEAARLARVAGPADTIESLPDQLDVEPAAPKPSGSPLGEDPDDDEEGVW